MLAVSCDWKLLCLAHSRGGIVHFKKVFPTCFNKLDNGTKTWQKQVIRDFSGEDCKRKIGRNRLVIRLKKISMCRVAEKAELKIKSDFLLIVTCADSY